MVLHWKQQIHNSLCFRKNWQQRTWRHIYILSTTHYITLAWKLLAFFLPQREDQGLKAELWEFRNRAPSACACMAKTNSIPYLFDGTDPPKNLQVLEICPDLYHGPSSKHRSYAVSRQSIPQAAQQCYQTCLHFWMLLEKFDLKKNILLNYEFPENHFTVIRSKPPFRQKINIWTCSLKKKN